MELFDDAREAWNEGADAYIEFVESGADYYRLLLHGPALLTACSEIRGVSALDLGCGQGYFSRELARAGARVTGVELSDRLLARALELEAAEPLGISYLRMDAAGIGDCFAAESLDLVTGCMSLQDMADPAAVLAGAARVLRSEGRALFSVPHPLTDLSSRSWSRDALGQKQALCIDGYFDTGPAILDWSMARLKYHWRTPYRRHTLAEWSSLIRDAGFKIRSLVEPRPSADLVAQHPGLEACSRLPYFLIFELVK